MAKLFRVVVEGGDQIILQVPDFPIPIRPEWTKEQALAFGTPVARKTIGEPWVGVLVSNQVDKRTGKILSYTVRLAASCQGMLDTLPEPGDALLLG